MMSFLFMFFFQLKKNNVPVRNNIKYNDVNKIEIYFIDPNQELFLRGDCETFEQRFSENMTHLSFNNDSDIVFFVNFYNDYSYLPDTATSDMDIRKKVYIHHGSGVTDTLCFDASNYTYYYRGKLWSIIKQH